MKNKHLIITTIACIGLLAIWAIPAKAYDQKYWSEQNFGRSFESAKFKQIINHEPVENKVMEDLDGQAAVKVMEQYRNSFGENKKQNNSSDKKTKAIGVTTNGGVVMPLK